MKKKVLYYLAAIIIGIGSYFIISHDIDLQKDVKNDDSQAKYIQGQEAFDRSFTKHEGFFQEEDYIEFAICTHYVGNRRFEIFTNIYTKEYKMLLVRDGHYHIYSQGSYSVNFDRQHNAKYWIFSSTPLDFYHAFYRHNSGGLRSGGTIFNQTQIDQSPLNPITYLSTLDKNQSRNFQQTRAIDEHLTGIDNFDLFTEKDTFCEKWFFIEKNDSFIDLRRNVSFSKNFGYFDRGKQFPK